MSIHKKQIYKIDPVGKHAILFSFLFLGLAYPIFSKNSYNQADSIIMKVLEHRNAYRQYIRNYDAQIYIKGNTRVKKKNILLRYAPDFLYLNTKGNNSLVEALVDFSYTSPDYFISEIKVLHGNRLNVNEIQKKVMRFLTVNIYNPSIFNDQILLPGVKNVFKYYRFEYIASFDTLGKTIHQINVVPKIKTQRLMSGFFYIVDGTWMIHRMDIKGHWEFSKFRVQMEYGFNPDDFLLPLNATIAFRVNILGNTIESVYFSDFKYKSVAVYDRTEKKRPINYNLSDYFNTLSDTIAFINDSLFWNKNRPVPLSPYEEWLFERKAGIQEESDTLAQLWKYTLGLIEPQKFNYNHLQFTYSGFLNPLKFAYSQLDGLLYWQQLTFYKHYGNGTEIQFKPGLGILFQKKELYFDIPIHWLFAPEKFGEVFFTYGNRNRSYNSTIISQMNEKMPGTIDFDDFDLEYYKHFYMTMGAKYELANGLLLQGAWDYDWYIPVRKETGEKNVLKNETVAGKTIDGDVIDIVNNQYRAFVPVLKLSWTPQPYYRIYEKRKEYLGSKFPCFSVEFARGLKGVFESNSDYERLEIDIQQKIQVGLMRSIHYYIGVGMFTNTHSIYFSDFKNFQRRNIPQSWNDPIGGTFHLLAGNWYNAANSYTQAHFMYESPFVLLHLFRQISKDILKERIYASQLYTPVLPCYTEIGYGAGNFLVNAGCFVSFNKGKYESIGVKFAFELGL